MYYIKLLSLLFSLTILSNLLFGQDRQLAVEKIQRLNKQYQLSEISDSNYIKAVGKWTKEQLGYGVFFERKYLEDLLSLYKKTISRYPNNTPLINYYLYMADNSSYQNRDGESVYYKEKAEEEVNKLDKGKPLFVVQQKAEMYKYQRNNDKLINLYYQNKDYFQQLPQLTVEKKVNANITALVVSILDPISEAAAYKKNKPLLDSIIDLAAKLRKTIVKISNNKPHITFFQNIYYNNILFHKYFVADHNKNLARLTLDNSWALVSDSVLPQEVLQQFKSLIWIQKVRYFTEFNELDSAKYYMNILNSSSNPDPNQIYSNKRLESAIYAKEQAYKKAYELLYASLNETDSIQGNALSEMDDLMYAYIQAEDSQNALLQSEREKRRRTLLLMGISLGTICAAGIIYYSMQRKNRLANQRVETLNHNANLQIAIMEEMKEQAITEEQKRLSRDLHDNVSSSIAAVKHQLEIFSMDQNNKENVELKRLLFQIEEVYNAIRNKSHSWYTASNEVQGKLFHSQINSLLKVVLPPSHYTVNVDIDQYSLQNTTTNTRINILRIIQEAVINIVKHAKADKVDILLFADSNRLILSLKDNGIGVNKAVAKTTKSLGLRSIKDRVQNLGGTMCLENLTEGGTELTVSIPIDDQ